MKMNKYFMLGLAGLAFAACSNEEDAIGSADTTNKTMIVSIAGIGADTKASAPVDPWSPDADATAAVTNINKLTLLFTDANGIVKYSYTGDKTNESEEWNALFTTQGVKFIGLTGVTAVHAIANQDVTLAVGEDINTLKTQYTAQGLDIEKNGIVYVGSDKTITPFTPEPSDATEEVKLPGAGEEGNFYYTAEIQLKPIISRIQINSINVVTSGSTKFGPDNEQDKYTLSWSSFKPVLNGIYLNNIATEFTDFAGEVNDLSKNTTYLQTIANGTWTLGGSNMTDDAAYVSFTSPDYGTLLSYGTENATIPEKVTTPLTIDDGKCIAFNVFVPLDVEDADNEMDEWASTNNPTIHFQFAKDVTGYTATPSLTAGGQLTPEDNAFIATAEENLAYQLPQVADGGYLFANITELHETSVEGALLQMQAGKIYNMDVEISPVNMTIDLDNPQSYNVVVKVTVLPFTEENIYPSLGE